VYPRASGYVRKWYFDIGAKVKEGELLAEIETPELDQQLLQARAQFAQAEAGLLQSKATADYSKQNLARYQSLLSRLLAKGRGERFADADEIITAAEGLRGGAAGSPAASPEAQTSAA